MIPIIGNSDSVAKFEELGWHVRLVYQLGENLWVFRVERKDKCQ